MIIFVGKLFDTMKKHSKVIRSFLYHYLLSIFD